MLFNHHHESVTLRKHVCYTDDEVDTAISCNEEAATEAATEAEKPGTAAIAADGEGEKEEDQPDVAAGIQVCHNT